ncbi:MAG: S-methyl-5'-thioinosine phosphorylase [Burkholderiaceae bacterium]|jgi:5'-methylthioinosine phosphorylase
MYAVIGGSGLARLPEFETTRKEVMRTPYGEASGAFTFGKLAGVELVFLARHGYGHTIAPHEINYRANIWALKQMNVSGIVAVASVGGITPAYPPGSFVVPDQIIDYTKQRKNTFFEGSLQPVGHVDFTQPYTENLRQQLQAAGAAAGEALIMGATYACTEGPRLETAAEIDRLERDGAHLVGMTGMPEAVLARELDLPYAALAVVANAAAGRGASAQGISYDQIRTVLQSSMDKVCRVLQAFVNI